MAGLWGKNQVRRNSSGLSILRGAAFGVCIGAGGLAVTPGHAQDRGGLTATGRMETTLGWNDTEGAFSRTGLDFNLDTKTRSQSLSASLGTALRIDEDGLALVEPRFDLAYGRATRSSELSFDLSWQQSDISTSFTSPGTDDFTAADLVTDIGTRTNTAAAFALSLGKEAPVGLDLALSTDRRRFEDTVDPDLYDTTTDRASITVHFRVDPRIDLTSALSWSDVDTGGNGVDRESLTLSLGGDFQVTPTLSVGASVGQTRIDILEAGVRRDEEGLSARLTGTQARPNGEIGVSLSSTVDAAGRQTALRFDRSLERRRGELALSFGLARPEGGDAQVLFGARLDQALTPTLELRLNLNQELSSNADAEDIRRTSLSGDIAYQATQTLRLTAGLSLFDINNLDGGEDIRRTSARVGVSRALTEDWALTGGVSWQETDSSTDGRDIDRSIYVGLGRDFAWRP